MESITNFVKVRADGKLVPGGMKVAEMLALGWGPCEVIGLRWTHANANVEFAAPYGTHGIVVPGAQFVATVHDEDSTGTRSHLLILSAHGAVHSKLHNRITASGVNASGKYAWFETPAQPGPHVFAIVFQADDGSSFVCDIDASGPRLLRVKRMQ
jgi:hypothetical protein